MTETPHNHWVIELSTPTMAAPLQLVLEDKLVIGRSIPDQQENPDIDLGPYGAEQAGVSRRHLVLLVDRGRLMLMDLNSQNGTFLYGDRLEPNVGYQLETGCKLQLGLLPIDLNILASPSLGSGIHTHTHVHLEDSPAYGHGQLVLVVEDDPTVARLLCKVMESVGYRAVMTHEVVSAIREYNKRRPAAILLDLMLPDMNGLEFCRYVRRDVVENTVPIVVVSAHASGNHVRDAMASGADVFVNKPFSIDELRQVVASLISQRANGKYSIDTKHLVGTAPLGELPPAARPHSAVLYVAGHSEEPITLHVQERVSFGRTLDSARPTPHIDLTQFGAVDLGVSRVHAHLFQKDDDFYVEDANSVNGSYVNGYPIVAGEPIQIKNGDEIRLGLLRMYIYFLEEGTP